jgi:hypothetical protein
VFHKPAQITQSVTATENAVTVNTYTGTGDLFTQTVAYGTPYAATTQYIWESGLLLLTAAQIAQHSLT